MLYTIKFFILLLLASCGSAPSTMSKSHEEVLRNKREEIREWVQPVMVQGNPTFAFNGRDVGDSLLWSGLLCLSGEEQFCEAIPLFQDVHGRFWRHPSRINVEVGDSFSRDMALGALAYILKTRSVAIMDSWMIYIDEHNGKLCPDDSDRRCTVTPKMYGLFMQVAKHINSNIITAKMILGQVGDDTTALIEAHNAPAGYPLHLIAVQLLLKKEMGIGNPILDQVAQVLVDRQPDNPFFRWLVEGSSDEVYHDLLKVIPDSRPKRLNQWLFQRDWSDKAWTQAVGYDIIAVINLVLGKE